MDGVAPRLLDVVQTARYLGLSKWTIRGFVEQGVLTPVGLPSVNSTDSRRIRRILFDRQDLDAFVEKHKSASE
jgi:hypothetical protein